MRAVGTVDASARYRTAIGFVVLLVVLLVARPSRLTSPPGDMVVVGSHSPGHHPYTWFIEDAEGPSVSRSGTSDAQRVTFRKSTDSDGDYLTWGEVIDLWIEDEVFREAWLASFHESVGGKARDRAQDYYWECAPVSASALDARYEHVIKDRHPQGDIFDTNAFAEHFGAAREHGKDVAVFANLGGDATLVAPLPDAFSRGFERAGGCIASFVRVHDEVGAPARVVHELVRAVGVEVRRALRRTGEPVWLSTNGDGVSWLHVRIDERPKYYTHGPYRTFRVDGDD